MRYLSVLLLTLVLCCSGTRGSAHALLDASEPPDGAALSQPVRDVKLIFAEKVTPLAIRMLEANGDIVRLTGVTSHSNTLIVHLPEGSQRGMNILSWRVMSDDGHPVGGTVTFSVDENRSLPADTDRLTFKTYRIGLWSSGFLLSVCVTVAVGGAVFRAWIASVRARWLGRLSTIAAVAGLLTMAAGITIQTLDGLGEDITAIRWEDVWWTLTMTSYGWASWLIAAGLVLSLTVSASRPLWLQRSLSLLSFGSACMAFLVTGHASAATPLPLVYPSIFLHVAGMLFWFGALLPIWAALGAGGVAQQTLARFSKPILAVTGVLLPSGLLLATVQLQSVQELWGSAYGIVLLLKLALLVPLFALGAVNRFILTSGVLRGEPAAVRWMARSVRGEILLAILVLGVIGLWRFTPPPREMASVRVTATGVQLHAHGIAAMVNLTFQPARIGTGQIRLSVLNLDSTALNARAVDVALFKPGSSTEPFHFTARRGRGATWEIDDVNFAVAGRWLVRVDIVMPDEDKVYARTSIDIANR